MKEDNKLNLKRKCLEMQKMIIKVDEVKYF